MADIRIKDLPTTATQTASDDFIALDGTVNGTRKIDASAPSFKTSVTSPSIVAPTTTNLTLAGGSTGASLVLGQGANAGTTLALKGTGRAKTQVGTDYNLRTFLSGTTVQIDGANDAENSYRNVSIQALKLSLLDSSGGNVLIGTTTDIAGSGGLKVAGTTAASSTTSGALQVSGGVGVSGAGYFGGLLNVSGSSGINIGAGFLSTGSSMKWSDADASGLVWAMSPRLGDGVATNFGFYAANTLVQRWSSSGNSTIGGSLTVSGTGTSTFAGSLSVGSASGSIGQNSITFPKIGGGSYANAFYLYNGNTTGAFGFSLYDTTEGAWRWITTNSGNFLIGTTTDGGQKLQVNGTAAFADAITVTTSAGLAASFTNATDNNWSAKFIKSGGNELQVSGNITANSGPSIRAVTSGGAAYAPLTVDGSTFTAKISSVAALTIASTGAATFAGAVTVNGAGTFGSSFGKVTVSQWSDATNYGAITLNGNTTAAGSLGIGGGASGDSTLYLNAPTGGKIESRINGTAALTIASTGAATFAGAVTVATNLTMGAASGVFTIGADTRASDLFIDINTAAANSRLLRFQTAGISRWQMGASSTAEGGANAGSNFVLNAYSDAGALLSAPLSITRSTGAATFAGAVSIGGNFTLPAASAATTRYIISASNNDGTVVFQNGVGSAVAGGSLQLSGLTHATRPGWVTVGLGSGSTRKFTVSDIGLPGGTDVFTVDALGATTISSTTPSTGAGSGALQVAGGIYAGAASVFAGAVSVGGTISQPTASAGQNNLQTLAANSGFWNNMNNNSNAGRFIYGVEGAAGATFTGSTANAAFAGSNAVNAFHLLANGAIAATVATTAIFVANTTAAPGSNPTGGGYLYVESGALKYRGSSGTVTTIANA